MFSYWEVSMWHSSSELRDFQVAILTMGTFHPDLGALPVQRFGVRVADIILYLCNKICYCVFALMSIRLLYCRKRSMVFISVICLWYTQTLLVYNSYYTEFHLFLNSNLFKKVMPKLNYSFLNINISVKK